MNLEHVLSAFFSTPLAILPEKAAVIRELLYPRASGVRRSEEDIAAVEERKDARLAALLASVRAVQPGAVRRQDGVVLAGRVAVMPIFGVLSQRVGGMERSSGGISTEEIGATLDSLVSDKQVKAVVMVYDSPGGSVFGVKELGDKIRAARDEKKIVALADPMAASAGYWLAAQASEVVVSPTGQVGSVGVISAHQDASKHYEEKIGVKTTLVTSSPYKAETHPYGPLGPEALAEMQTKVNYYHGQFVDALAKGRNTTESRVEKGFGQGRMMTAEQAKAAGMVDRIGTLSDTLHRLGAGGPSAEADRARVLALADVDATLAKVFSESCA